MKIVLDIDKLLAEGRITAEEYAKLRSFAAEDTGSLAFNILIGFGVIATAGGALALVPAAATALVLGLLLSGAGLFLSTTHVKEWGLLGSILLLVGSLMTAGGILALTEGSVVGFLIVTALCLAGGIVAKSGLLVCLAALALSATIGAATAYHHAMYALVIRQPTLTVVLFGLLAWGSYVLSLHLEPDFQRLTILFARTSLFLVNLGFWVGSLWGDSLWQQQNVWDYRSGELIPDWVFVIGWAVGLVTTGVWAAKRDKRWVVNLLAVFGTIHFYTQFFERLGASPG